MKTTATTFPQETVLDKEKQNYPFGILMMAYLFLFAMIAQDLLSNPEYALAVVLP